MIHKWHTRQIDFVQAYPQAPLERDMYMEVPKGFDITDGDPEGDYVIQVHQNIYRQKQAGQVWNHYLVEHVKKVGFIQSEHDPQQMKAVGLKITCEGEIEVFLGINIECINDG
jgi:hypothetical protein